MSRGNLGRKIQTEDIVKGRWKWEILLKEECIEDCKTRCEDWRRKRVWCKSIVSFKIFGLIDQTLGYWHFVCDGFVVKLYCKCR